MSNWSKAGPEERAKILARNKVWQRANPEKVRASHRAKWLKKKYGVSIAEWEALFEQQGRKCACCGATTPGRQYAKHKGEFWCTDHDHKRHDLHIRAILCNPCNCLAGYANDSPDRLRAVADYLERYQAGLVNEL
jgi:hypothetical protein